MKRDGIASRDGIATNDDDIMTLREVATYLGLHVMTVYKLTREGRVPAAKIGGQWRFKRDVLEDWLKSQMHRNTLA
jgi:excisionase family DNA binding protein